jgi:hypothetical protein
LKNKEEAALNAALKQIARVQRLKTIYTSLKVRSDKLLARSIIELDEEDSVTSSAPVASSSASLKILDLPPADNPF